MLGIDEKKIILPYYREREKQKNGENLVVASRLLIFTF